MNKLPHTFGRYRLETNQVTRVKTAQFRHRWFVVKYGLLAAIHQNQMMAAKAHDQVDALRYALITRPISDLGRAFGLKIPQDGLYGVRTRWTIGGPVFSELFSVDADTSEAVLDG